MGAQVILSHYGLRFFLHQGSVRSASAVAADPVLCALASLYSGGASNLESSVLDHLVSSGLAEVVQEELRPAGIALRYSRNPIENVRRIVFEYTRLCNFHCAHCRNASVVSAERTEVPALRKVVDSMIAVGIRRFDFIGGEVTRFGDGWLELTRGIRTYADTTVAVVTNGWFLEQRSFRAAGVDYVDDRAFLNDLRDQGVTHVIYSLDGPEERHDVWRGHPGLYRRILAGIDKTRAAGLEPRVSVVLTAGPDASVDGAWLLPIALRLYGSLHPYDALLDLMSDELNYKSNFIDVGAGAALGQGQVRTCDIPESALRCKNYFRPSPSLRIQASGEVSCCPLLDAGEGYGNVQSQSLVDIVNQMPQALPFRVHAEGRLGDYRRFLEETVIKDRVDHVCTFRALLLLVAREVEQRRGELDRSALREINLRVGRKTGMLRAGVETLGDGVFEDRGRGGSKGTR